MTDHQHTGRSIELEVEVPGTPTEVWDTIATGPGITSWFIPMQVEERSGGEVTMDWGSFGSETADVVAWEAPHRVLFRGRGDNTLAFEWLVGARDGGSCVVRLVNSGFGEGDHWDEQYDGMSEGWKVFLQNLRLQLTYFRNRRARAIIPTVMTTGPNADGWATFCEALGIPADAGAGDRIETAVGVPPLGGTVETAMRGPAATAYLLVIDDPAPGTAFVTVEGDGDQVAASAYLYLYTDEQEVVDDAGSAWTAWLGERFQPMGAELIE